MSQGCWAPLGVHLQGEVLALQAECTEKSVFDVHLGPLFDDPWEAFLCHRHAAMLFSAFPHGIVRIDAVDWDDVRATLNEKIRRGIQRLHASTPMT